MAKAYSYLRMSTEVQLRGDSLRRQLELSKDYAEKNGLQLESADQYKDIGVSAFKGDNVATGALGRFLKAVEAGSVKQGSYLLVESLDRLSREQVLNAFSLFISIIERGIVIVTLGDGFEYSKALLNSPEGTGKLMFSLMVMSRAHEESLTKSKRIGAAWSNKRAKAAQQKLTAIAPSWLKLSEDRKSFVVLEDRAKLVQQMFEDCKNGVGVIATARRLNETSESWNGPKGWHTSFVYKILTNRAVLGEYHPHSYAAGKREPLEPIKDYYPRIVSDDLFYAAKLARETRKHRGGRRGESVTSLFTTLVKCGYCKRPIRLVNKGAGPKGGLYLRCEAAVRAHGCKASSWPYQQFETNFLSLVTEVDFSQVVSDEAERAAVTTLKEKRDVLIQKALEDESREKNLVEALEKASAAEPPVTIVARIGALAASREAAKKEAKKLDDEIKSRTMDFVNSTERTKLIAELYVRMKSCDKSELYALRARIAQLILSVVREILIFADGRVRSEKTLAETIPRLRSAGYTEEEIAYFAKEDTRSTAEKRAYFVWLRSGEYRFVRPDPVDATQYSFMKLSPLTVESLMKG